MRMFGFEVLAGFLIEGCLLRNSKVDCYPPFFIISTNFKFKYLQLLLVCEADPQVSRNLCKLETKNVHFLNWL